MPRPTPAPSAVQRSRTRAVAAPASQKGIASVETAIRLVRIVEASETPLSLSEIARLAGFEAGKTHHYMVSLVRSGLIERVRGSALYRLGGFSLQLGLAALNRTGISGVVSSALRELRAATGHTALFSVWGAEGPIVTHLEEGSVHVDSPVRAGTVLPLVRSPTAEVFIAWLPDEELQPTLHTLEPLLLPLQQVVEIRERTRRAGGATGTRTPRIVGMSAPVFGHSWRLVGAMSLIGQRGELDTQPGSATFAALNESAKQLSAAIRAA
ncbi:MAG: helix-turn-helix domain-containing protein [Pseudomonadota bacterium]